ncbi:hypothetical protein ASPVEDRAFT_122650 [Aspergillus versicolor CBS 583.65]|uniref:Major facilitator superfamily (MFS) profile domain-containing protein n=1 Tax=Aspergillus versicolor CBS 583.65 TaxID=1036611 RepID=A0A1L9P792_ASPVE|nr:uncharacterized protein ASPVEDRAFT_122650 [Aspergillus versicolor CBS 583.65]OJI97294.1 hypothetical protein ASPVEDRAFT_122650 [Aspergillus versicolor CBS 583.65]
MSPRTDHEKATIEHVDAVRTYGSDEESKSTWQTLKSNPKIIALCFFANVGPLMYGFDNLATSLCLSMPAFELQFGEMVDESPVIAAWWQSVWNAMGQIGTMLGAVAIGFIADRFGRRACFAISAVFSAAGIAVLYICSTPGVFLAGKTINALSLGMAISVGQTYIAEITPVAMRGIALSGFTFSMNLGYMIAASVAFKRLTVMDASAYRVLFAAGWVWPGLMLLLFSIIPESPFHLVRQGSRDKARKALIQLSPKGADITTQLTAIEWLVEDERSLANEAQSASFVELFNKDNIRRTRIIIYCNALNQMIGATFIGNGPYFLISAGLPSSSTGMLVEIGIAFAICSSIITWFLIPRTGNRTLMLWGTAGSALFFIIIGVSGCFYTKAAKWTTGIGLQLVWWSIGPCIGPAMSVAGQVSQARLRAKSQSLGFGFNYFFSAIWNVCVPYMFNTDQGNLGGKMGFIYLATAVIAWVAIFFDVPETKGRSFAELDEMFQLGLPARGFKTWREADVE